MVNVLCIYFGSDVTDLDCCLVILAGCVFRLVLSLRSLHLTSLNSDSPKVVIARKASLPQVCRHRFSNFYQCEVLPLACEQHCDANYSMQYADCFVLAFTFYKIVKLKYYYCVLQYSSFYSFPVHTIYLNSTLNWWFRQAWQICMLSRLWCMDFQI